MGAGMWGCSFATERGDLQGTSGGRGSLQGIREWRPSLVETFSLWGLSPCLADFLGYVTHGYREQPPVCGPALGVSSSGS